MARNRGTSPEKILEKNDKYKKKKKYQDKYWSMRQEFTSLVYMVCVMVGRYSRAA